MNRELNPFKPGSRLRPPALEGRDQQIDDFDLLIARSKSRTYDRGIDLVRAARSGQDKVRDAT